MKKNLKEFIPLIKLVKEDLNKIILASIVIFISGITDNIDGEIDKYDIELTIYHEENIVPVYSIEDPGLYDIYFKISDIAGNENNSLRKAIVPLL